MASELNVANQILTAASVKTLDNYIIKRIVVCLLYSPHYNACDDIVIQVWLMVVVINFIDLS